MGGRGASSGISVKSKKYGTQYRTVLEVDNIKFVSKIDRNSETLMETMTKGRVYVQVGGEELKSIIYFDENNKRRKAINLDHSHKNLKGSHIHRGYYHNEYSINSEPTALNHKEGRLLAKIEKLWYNYINKK